MCGCGSSRPRHTYTVGVDPSFFPVDFEGKEMYVLAFTNDLLEEISHIQHIELIKVPRAWDNLVFGLKQKQFDAILSPMQPILQNEKNFDFSEVYLETGPVLVVQKTNSIDLRSIRNGYIGVIPRSKAAFFVETQNNLMPKYYHNSGQLCYAVDTGEIDGALIDIVPAVSYVQDQFDQNLMIHSPPMFHQGLRLVTLKGMNRDVIIQFNQGLETLKKKGTYQKLLQKWKLGK